MESLCRNLDISIVGLLLLSKSLSPNRNLEHIQSYCHQGYQSHPLRVGPWTLVIDNILNLGLLISIYVATFYMTCNMGYEWTQLTSGVYIYYGNYTLKYNCRYCHDHRVNNGQTVVFTVCTTRLVHGAFDLLAKHSTYSSHIRKSLAYFSMQHSQIYTHL